jgi:mono/diheme cytochrome c family protein
MSEMDKVAASTACVTGQPARRARVAVASVALLVCGSVLVGVSGLREARAEAVVQAGPVDFTRDVLPIFEKSCVECHGPDKVKARLRMDSVEALQKGGKNGALLKPGDPENSLLMRRVLGLDGEDQMPLDADPLTEAQVDTLRRWIAAGATYPAGSH